MIAYHEISSNDLQSALTNGLQKTSRGSKGSDKWIIKTDEFLDVHRPKHLREAGISRDDNIYAYVATDEFIVDIVHGSHIPIKEFIAQSKDSVLKLTLDPKRCYVSDLDTYDALKTALSSRENSAKLETLAKSYWSKLIPLESFEIGTFIRPEILVTYDLNPPMLEKA